MIQRDSSALQYNTQAHSGAVLSLAYSPSYVVSLGEDGRLCVWERMQGHLINSINTLELGESECPDLVGNYHRH